MNMNNFPSGFESATERFHAALSAVIAGMDAEDIRNLAELAAAGGEYLGRVLRAQADAVIAAGEDLSDEGLGPRRIRVGALDPLDFERVEI